MPYHRKPFTSRSIGMIQIVQANKLHSELVKWCFVKCWNLRRNEVKKFFAGAEEKPATGCQKRSETGPTIHYLHKQESMLVGILKVNVALTGSWWLIADAFHAKSRPNEALTPIQNHRVSHHTPNSFMCLSTNLSKNVFSRLLLKTIPRLLIR